MQMMPCSVSVQTHNLKHFLSNSQQYLQSHNIEGATFAHCHTYAYQQQCNQTYMIKCTPEISETALEILGQQCVVNRYAVEH